MKRESNTKRIAGEHDLQEGGTLKFEFTRAGKKCEGMLLRYRGELRAYENLCMHMPLTIDYGDGRFFTKDGKHLICQTHSALYEPLSGLCVRGPCAGASLRPLAIEVREGAVWFTNEDPVS